MPTPAHEGESRSSWLSQQADAGQHKAGRGRTVDTTSPYTNA